MKEHGILMKGEMVRAYLEDRKWMTRRTRGLDFIDQNPDEWRCEGLSANGEVFVFSNLANRAIPQLRIKPPYGYISDQLWFKETYAILCREFPCEYHEDEHPPENGYDAAHYVEYRADTGNAHPGDWPEEEAKGNDEAPKWLSSMYMPRKYSRITVPIVNVRVERLQDISIEDAKAEGASKVWHWHKGRDPKHWPRSVLNPYVANYSVLWDEINAKRGMGWDVNPWVWVYEFPKYSNLEVNTVCSLGFDMRG